MISKPPIPSPTSHTAYDSNGSCDLPASLARVPPCADAAVEKSKNRGGWGCEGWGQLSVGATFPPHLEPYSPTQSRSRSFEGQANSLMKSHGRTISTLGFQTPARSRPGPLHMVMRSPCKSTLAEPVVEDDLLCCDTLGRISDSNNSSSHTAHNSTKSREGHVNPQKPPVR